MTDLTPLRNSVAIQQIKDYRASLAKGIIGSKALPPEGLDLDVCLEMMDNTLSEIFIILDNATEDELTRRQARLNLTIPNHEVIP